MASEGASAPGIVFAAPRTRFEIDVAAITAQVPDTVTTKGMFFVRCLAVAEGQDEDALLRAAGLHGERLVPFADYPWVKFVRLAAAVADARYGGRTAIGLREIGRTLYADFAASLVGRMTFGTLWNNADRVIGVGAKAWNMSGIPGRVEAVSIGDRHYHYRFYGHPVDIIETVAIGILEGALHVCGELAKLGFAAHDAMTSTVEIRW